MKTLSFLLLLQLSSVNAGAALVTRGVRVVGKGGGFAEMQAYAFDKSVVSLAQFCIHHIETCSLTLDEYNILESFLSFFRKKYYEAFGY